VCNLTGHSPCLCQAIYTYGHFELFFNIFILTIFAFYIKMSMYTSGLSVQDLHSRLSLMLIHYLNI
jgi:hypothetical protein